MENNNEIREYDERNNLIHHKDSNGYEVWREYDENNNLIHSKNNDGYESWSEYDERNNLIHYKTSDGYEYWWEYDKNNNLIHYKDSNGYDSHYKSIEIYFSDLNEKGQKKLLEGFNVKDPKEMNWDMDIIPIAVIDVEDCEEE